MAKIFNLDVWNLFVPKKLLKGRKKISLLFFKFVILFYRAFKFSKKYNKLNFPEL